jgi:hypothetical protein
MSAHGTITRVWSNGEDTFCIATVGSILDLEQKCNAGLGEIVQRVVNGMWRLNDVREAIRIGLIGGGMTPLAAQGVIERHVDARPLSESVLLAQDILAAAIVAPPGEQPGKTPADRDPQGRPSSTPKAGSPGSPSTRRARASAGRRGKPTSTPSGN